MSYNFNPMTDEEINSFGLVEKGIYNFEVVKSTRKKSKSGNDMAEIQLTLWDNEGRIHYVYDYLIFSDVPLNIKKVKHFCDAVGLSEDYKKGCLPEEMASLGGKVSIGIQEETAKPGGGFYPKKNVVVDYISSQEKDVKPKVSESEFSDADIPF